ncbi:hypothetical protein K505DRAFT_193653, partial [Melanomma pulvis-pyrius CBS 109.77]
ATTEILDLGRDRFDHDTAAIGDRDTALHRTPGTVKVAKGRAPPGLEPQVFAWNSLQYMAAEENAKEALKGSLHRAARAPQPPQGPQGGAGGAWGGQLGRGDGQLVREDGKLSKRRRGGKGGTRGGRATTETDDCVVAARGPAGDVPPLAKGCAVELDRSLFWEENIV